MCKTKAACARRQSGLSLIELMVALVIGLIFAIAVLIVQSKLTQQNLQMTDVMERDTQARAALDIITSSLSNAGFMVGGGVQSPCAAVLAYNAGLATPVFSQYPVTAANQPLALPVAIPPTGSNNNPNNYPPAGSANVTQLITIRSTDSDLRSAKLHDKSAPRAGRSACDETAAEQHHGHETRRYRTVAHATQRSNGVLPGTYRERGARRVSAIHVHHQQKRAAFSVNGI